MNLIRGIETEEGRGGGERERRRERNWKETKMLKAIISGFRVYG